MCTNFCTRMNAVHHPPCTVPPPVLVAAFAPTQTWLLDCPLLQLAAPTACISVAAGVTEHHWYTTYLTYVYSCLLMDRLDCFTLLPALSMPIKGTQHMVIMGSGCDGTHCADRQDVGTLFFFFVVYCNSSDITDSWSCICFGIPVPHLDSSYLGLLN